MSVSTSLLRPITCDTNTHWGDSAFSRCIIYYWSLVSETKILLNISTVTICIIIYWNKLRFAMDTKYAYIFKVLSWVDNHKLVSIAGSCCFKFRESIYFDALTRFIKWIRDRIKVWWLRAVACSLLECNISIEKFLILCKLFKHIMHTLHTW